tara:strand:+ start:364 stop:591 length:228 start_codon:yes stop_codon:yes gene_type:complete
MTTFNKTELQAYTTTQLIELQDEILEQIEEVKERIEDGSHWMCNPENGYDLEDILWGLAFTSVNIFDVLTERAHK